MVMSLWPVIGALLIPATAARLQLNVTPAGLLNVIL